MLLDPPRGEDKRVPLPVRVPKSLKKSIDKRAGKRRGDLTGVIVGDLELGSHLYERLAEKKPDLQRFALDQALDWGTQAPEVYARLILLGLEHAKK